MKHNCIRMFDLLRLLAACCPEIIMKQTCSKKVKKYRYPDKDDDIVFKKCWCYAIYLSDK